MFSNFYILENKSGMKYYPVIIPTLNRFDHFRNCVESLSRCKGSEETELIIGLDYPPSEKYADGHSNIKSYIPKITGFAKVTVFEREYNYGAAANFYDLKEYALKDNEAVIGTEDDNVFASGFLEFVNSALESYFDDSNVRTVCGFIATKFYDNTVDAIYTHDSSAWGCGMWRHKEQIVHNRRKFVSDIVFSLNKTFKIYREQPGLITMLCSMYDRGNMYGDAIRTATNILQNRWQVKPSISLVRNMGHDGSGLHSVDSPVYDFHNQTLSDRVDYRINSKSKSKYIQPKDTFFYGMPQDKLLSLKCAVVIILKYLIFRFKHLNHKE